MNFFWVTVIQSVVFTASELLEESFCTPCGEFSGKDEAYLNSLLLI